MSTKYKTRDQISALPAGKKLHFITFVAVDYAGIKGLLNIEFIK